MISLDSDLFKYSKYISCWIFKAFLRYYYLDFWNRNWIKFKVWSEGKHKGSCINMKKWNLITIQFDKDGLKYLKQIKIRRNLIKLQIKMNDQ